MPEPLDVAQPIPACILFAPVDFVLEYGLQFPPETAVWIRVDELPEGSSPTYGPAPGETVLSEAELTVDGYPARVWETRLADAVGPDRYTRFVVQLAESRYLVAETRSQPDYDANALVLRQMMQTLEFTSP